METRDVEPLAETAPGGEGAEAGEVESAAVAGEEAVTAEQAAPCAGGLLYGVRPGETLFSIAGKFGVTLQALLNANPGINPQNLQVCQVLCVPGVQGRLCPGGSLVTVQAGQSMFAIAQQFGVPLAALVAANPWIPNPSFLCPREQLCVPGAPPVRLPRCFVLEPTPVASGLDVRGSALLESASGGGSRVTVAAVNLPDPSAFGQFDAYFAGVASGVPMGTTTIQLSTAAAPFQPVVWAGAGVFNTLNPGDVAGVDVFPVNTSTGGSGPVVLSGDARSTAG